MKLHIVLVTVFSLMCTYALACDNTTTQTSMTICHSEVAKSLNKSLKIFYDKLLSTQTDVGQKNLIAAQAAWAEYRDAQCTFNVAGAQGGSIQPMLYALCYKDITEKRITELKTHLECAEGDMGCGGQIKE